MLTITDSHYSLRSLFVLLTVLAYRNYHFFFSLGHMVSKDCVGYVYILKY